MAITYRDLIFQGFNIDGTFTDFTEIEVAPISENGLPTSGDDFAISPVTFQIVDGEIDASAKLAVPGNYTFYLRRGTRKVELRFSRYVGGDVLTPISVAQIFASEIEASQQVGTFVIEGARVDIFTPPIGGVEGQLVAIGPNDTLIAADPTAASSIDWTNVTNKPSTFPPDSHTHDDRYYTETEIDSLLDAVATALDGKADLVHNHDDRYYTEAEVDALLSSVTPAPPEVAIFSHQEPGFTQGGASDGTVQKRILNTTEKSQSWASLSSNTVTLAAGTYSFRYAFTVFANFCCGYLKDETNTAYLDVSPEHSGGDHRVAKFWRDVPPTTFAGSTDIAIYTWRPDSSGDTSAFGNSLNPGPDSPVERFCELIITKH